ncbi:hypothetical protein NQ314_010568 [Rhamnusium bicolor]|uniref:Uncharacterized protein n=1 Tax=Rhamnusium bicolor TaxID=1586634 RepID=A0AAV8XQV4_9CUCU|nr:hypothetical protein NQ314_010568 [Rhamnusium bicolor]
MACSYGDRGSLTVYCVNATTQFFKLAPYRFDHLDETLKCVNCSLASLDSGTFDISGNQIKALDIRNSSINKIWPKAFIGLIFMEKLLLSDNSIIAIYPGAFIGVRKVKYLELENSGLANLESYVFQELYLLEVLILRKNKFSLIRDKTFDGLNNLKILDLSFNQLVTLNNSFDPLVSLRVLKLHDNQITRIYGNEFSNLKSLLSLNLENNILTNFTINIEPDNHLRILNLAKNKLTTDGIKMGSFQNLNNLEELDLSQNYIKNIPPKFFQGLFLLRVLNLHHNKIRELSTGTFTGLPHLMTLNVSSNYLETAKVSGQLLLHSLHTLDLADNNLKKFDYIEFIAQLPRIASINLLGNDLPCETFLEIETLFIDDNIRFLMSSNKPFEKCDNVLKTRKEILKKLVEDKFGQPNNETSAVIWIVLMCIIILAIAILFYVQFFILYRMRTT